jgi:hypothetical protein
VKQRLPESQGLPKLPGLEAGKNCRIARMKPAIRSLLRDADGRGDELLVLSEETEFGLA